MNLAVTLVYPHKLCVGDDVLVRNMHLPYELDTPVPNINTLQWIVPQIVTDLSDFGWHGKEEWDVVCVSEVSSLYKQTQAQKTMMVG